MLSDSSMAAERVPTVRISELAEYIEVIERAFGNAPSPMMIGTDNMPNQRVAGGEASAARSRHDLQRYLRIQQRIASGTCVVRHTPDAENPADYLPYQMGPARQV